MYDGWMYVCVNIYNICMMDGWMDVYIDEWMYVCVNVYNICMMDGWVDGCIYRWMDVCMCECMYV
jgi:hypothetical protein